jgi:hypothetical protein
VLNPLIGKSVAMYFTKREGAQAAVAAQQAAGGTA